MFVSPLELTALARPNEWALLRPLVWQLCAERVEIPAGFVTDLASIPRVFRNVLNVNGRSRRAAVLHDFLYCRQDMTRAAADDFLYRALVAEGMHPAIARTYWAGVRIGGWVPWRRRQGGGLRAEDFVSREAFERAQRDGGGTTGSRQMSTPGDP